MKTQKELWLSPLHVKPSAESGSCVFPLHLSLFMKHYGLLKKNCDAKE